MAELNGIPVCDHIGKTVQEILPNLAAFAEEVTERILRTQEPVLDIEISAETPAHPGTERTFLEHWLPLKDDDGYIFGFNVVVAEITERKKAKQELKRSDELLGQPIRSWRVSATPYRTISRRPFVPSWVFPNGHER